MKRNVHSTWLLLDIALRCIWAVWTIHYCTVSWERTGKTILISFTIHNLKGEEDHVI